MRLSAAGVARPRAVKAGGIFSDARAHGRGADHLDTLGGRSGSWTGCLGSWELGPFWFWKKEKEFPIVERHRLVSKPVNLQIGAAFCSTLPTGPTGR